MTVAEFKTRFPEFNDVDDTLIEMLIEEGELSVGANFGKFRDLALLYFVAHSVELSNNGLSASSGSIASQSVDGVSVSYSTPANLSEYSAYFGSTGYGQKYLYYFNIVKRGQSRVV